MLNPKVICIYTIFTVLLTVTFGQEDRLGQIVNKILGKSFNDIKDSFGDINDSFDNIKDVNNISSSSTVLFASNVFKQNSNASIDREESGEYDAPVSAYEYGGDSYKREVNTNSKDNKLDPSVDKPPVYGSEAPNPPVMGVLPPHLTPFSVRTAAEPLTSTEKPFEVVTNAYDRPQNTPFGNRATPSNPSDANLNESIIDQLKSHFGRDHAINNVSVSDLTKSALFNRELVEYFLRLNRDKNAESGNGRTLADADADLDFDDIGDSYENEGSDESVNNDDIDDTEDGDIESEPLPKRFKTARRKHFRKDDELEEYDEEIPRSPRKRIRPFRLANRPRIADYNDYSDYDDAPTRNFRKNPRRLGSPARRRLDRDENDYDYDNYPKRISRRKPSRRADPDSYEDDYELPRRKSSRPFTSQRTAYRRY